jgi:cyanobactin maturation PatA/PatG family protease
VLINTSPDQKPAMARTASAGSFYGLFTPTIFAPLYRKSIAKHFCELGRPLMGNGPIRADEFATAIARGADTSGDLDICIAILDGPVDRTHPCFRGAELELVPTWVTAADDGAAARHGTHVASIIFGQPGGEIRGIAPRCRGLIIPVFGDAPEGGVASCLQLDLARAILMAVERGAHIINISAGQPASSREAEPLLAEAIRTCEERNILIVAAAGNDGCECLHLPAAAQSVLSVGASDSDGKPLASSNWGSAYQTQGIIAPGQDIVGAAPRGDTVRRSGTSFAAAVVSGVAGLLLGLQLRAGRTPDPHHVRSVLLQTALQCVPQADRDHRRCLAGRLNVIEAIIFIQGETNMTNASIATLGEASSAVEGGMPREHLSIAPAIQPFEAAAIHLSELAAGAIAKVADGASIAPSCGDDSKCGCASKGSCGCGGGAQKPALVYALGTLGYDFGSEARRDSFIQAMPSDANNPFIPEQLLSYLSAHPYEAASVIWTLNLDATPIYAVVPAGPYAAGGYDRLREALAGQLTQGVELVSIPGVIGGSVRLQSGQVVPAIIPAVRGIYHWGTKPLVSNVLGPRPKAAEAQAAYDRQSLGLSDFLNRVYYDLRNLGITAEERALNYSAVNAVQVAEVVRSATRDEFDLDRIDVRKSPVCRPESDCYDVELLFFNPNNINIANRVFRFTVDVSDVIPVTIGTVRAWTRR